MGVRLPPEYQEVEWIGSNNDAYLVIKNAVGLPEATNLKVKTTVLWKYVITRQVHGRNGRCYFGVADGYYQNTQTGTGHTQIEAVANEWASVEWSRNDSVCTLKVGNDIDITNSTVTATDPIPFALFALGDGSIRCYCALKETQVEIGSEQFDLIPCYRKQDSKPGMYDLASDTFFVNQGSREFDIGPDVIDSISPWLVARRRALMKEPELYPVGTNIRAKYGAVFVSKHTIDTITGEYVEKISHQASPVYMPISPKYTYWKRGIYPNRGYLSVLAFYDKDKNYIGYYAKNDYNDFVIPDIPANARYARIAIPSGSATDVKIIRTA